MGRVVGAGPERNVEKDWCDKGRREGGMAYAIPPSEWRGTACRRGLGRGGRAGVERPGQSARQGRRLQHVIEAPEALAPVGSEAVLAGVAQQFLEEAVGEQAIV